MRTRVQDVMTIEVLAVDPSTPFRELVSLLAAYRLSALPVVDRDRRVIGIVSASDLLLRERGRPLVAADFMTSPAVTVGPRATVREAARVAKASGVKRLPVVDGQGRLVGIVSRADLLKVFLRADDDIRLEVVRDVILNGLLLDPTPITVDVRDGVVTLRGTIERRCLIPLLVRLIYAVDGVTRVQHQLRWRLDDLDLAAAIARART